MLGVERFGNVLAYGKDTGCGFDFRSLSENNLKNLKQYVSTLKQFTKESVHAVAAMIFWANTHAEEVGISYEWLSGASLSIQILTELQMLVDRVEEDLQPESFKPLDKHDRDRMI